MHRVLSVVGWRPREAARHLWNRMCTHSFLLLGWRHNILLAIILITKRGRERETLRVTLPTMAQDSRICGILNTLFSLCTLYGDRFWIYWNGSCSLIDFLAPKSEPFGKRTGRRLNLDDRPQGDYIYFIIRLFATHPPIKCGFKYKFNAIYNANGR